LVAPCIKEVIAVDREAAMLDAARLHPVATDNITYIEGDVLDLPLKDGSVDVAMFFLVLHHVQEPAVAITEATRITRSGGRILVVDMQEHDRDEYRHTMGHLHLGFSNAVVESWCNDAGISVSQRRSLPPTPGAIGPSLFCAVLDVP
jgi:ArsR family transcriptional regulator